jgi:LmbE family N-acetylglucosaminyl deacetylase
MTTSSLRGLFLRGPGLLALLLVGLVLPAPAQDTTVEPVRVIAIFAHPDDGDYKMGGTAALMAQMGHQVKFLSLTNGDAGHYKEGGGVLGKRRRAEAKEAARRLGIEEYEVLDYHDAELMPTLNVRLDVIRAIREWDADVVLGLRPNDYHPDHRNAGKVVQDASYMVQVPNVAPDTPPTASNPVFLYMQDGFTKPYPFEPDIAVAIDDVFETKVDGLDAHVSQMYEWLPWIGGYIDEVPEGAEARRAWLEERYRARSGVSPDVRQSLEKWYGAQRAQEVQYAEAFEIAEYGYQPSDAEIRQLFPMLAE